MGSTPEWLGGSVPCRADHRQAYAEGDAQVCPGVGRDGFEKGADLEGSRCVSWVDEVWHSWEGGVRSVIGWSLRAYIKRLAAPREEHICEWNRSARHALPIATTTRVDAHKLPRPPGSTLSRRGRTLSSSCRLCRCRWRARGDRCLRNAVIDPRGPQGSRARRVVVVPELWTERIASRIRLRDWECVFLAAAPPPTASRQGLQWLSGSLT